MNKQDFIIIYLTVNLLILQILYMKEVRRSAYLEGQLAVMTSFQEAVNQAVGYPESRPK
jgi:hypothetical protein